MTRFNDKYRRVCESLDWTCSNLIEERITLSKRSPAGEDFYLVANIENFVDDVKRYTAHFDIDEHVEMWIEARRSGVTGVPSIRELVKDAEAINEMLRELAIALARAEN